MLVTSSRSVVWSPTESEGRTVATEVSAAGVWTTMLGHEVEKASGAPVSQSVPEPAQSKVRSPAALARYVQAKVRVWPAGMGCGGEAMVTGMAVPAPAICGSAMVTASAPASPSFVASTSSVNCWPTVTVAGSG